MNPLPPEYPHRHMSVEQYLAFEQQSTVRHEYLAGEVFAMAGAGVHHNGIANRLLAVLAIHLHGSPWQVFMSEVRVRVKTHLRDYFYYPDILVVPDSERRADNPEATQFVRNPRLIIEVISPSTDNIDRREKAMMYREIPALEEYVIVAQEECEVTVYRRRQNWRPIVYNILDELAEFSSVNLAIPLTQIYRDAPSGKAR